jgi:hypothetical protein
MNLNGSWVDRRSVTGFPPTTLPALLVLVAPETDLDAFEIPDGTLVAVFWIPFPARPRKPFGARGA